MVDENAQKIDKSTMKLAEEMDDEDDNAHPELTVKYNKAPAVKRRRKPKNRCINQCKMEIHMRMNNQRGELHKLRMS